MPKIVNFGSFCKPEAYGQTVLPDMSTLLGQKSMENANIEKSKCDIMGQKFIKNAKNGQFWRVFENSLQSNSVTKQVTFNKTKISGKCQNSKIQNATL